MSTALIIGGTGFLGRTLSVRARAAGLEPVIFAPDARPGSSDMKTITGDVCSAESFDLALRSVKPRVVFHLAAFGVGGEGLIKSAELDPVQATRVNVLGFTTAWHASALHGIERFVWSSSTSVYGSMSYHGVRPLDEDVKPCPDTIYGATKLAAEQLAATLLGRPGHAVGVRLPSVYGAGRYPGALRTFTTFVEDVARGKPTCVEASPSPVDWIHVVDAAEALLAAAAGSPRRLIYNVVGHRASTEEMARAVAARATARAEVTTGRADDAPALMEGKRFEQDFGFRPVFDLPGGVEEYVTATAMRRHGGDHNDT